MRELIKKIKNECLLPYYFKKNLKDNYPILYDYIIENTKFLSTGAEFPERLYCILNNIIEKPICKICNNHTTFKNGKYGYNKHCSVKCGNMSQDSKEKRKKTCSRKYGVDNVFLSSDFSEKSKKTCLKKYKTEYAQQNQEVRKKIVDAWKLKEKQIKTTYTNTCLEKYGVSHPSQSNIIKEKNKLLCFSQHGVTNINKLQEYKDNLKKIQLSYGFDNLINKYINFIPLFTKENYKGVAEYHKWKCIACGHIINTRLDGGFELYCPICTPKPKSKEQEEIFQYLTNKKIYVEQNKRHIIHNGELDLYIPSKNIAIEYNGIYWHSELSNNIDKKYHLNKLNKCTKLNIQLIQIFSDEWYLKKKIVLGRLNTILGLNKYRIHGRKCTISIINKKQKTLFLEKYHIQGNDKSKIYLGSFYKNRLVAVMTFSKLRKALGNDHKNNYWELCRYASIRNFRIPGIASKLLTYFIKTFEPIKIVSYSDLRWSVGNLYTQLGFKLQHQSPPNYWYTKYHKDRIHRASFMKHMLKKKLTIYDQVYTEWENMILNGYDRIWDCGNLVFVKEIIKN